ncbi:helix-turn-helix domain-containing protein [Massilia sp. HP4]|uniref:helix-turn-helix domain-containing protein n=1 Tax=Massilia sp. HP4 TaxID=2562316 RepID=UPI0010C0D2E2|nr:helix-turn-helix domain-containing protein [Massilia sp. HP4]
MSKLTAEAVFKDFTQLESSERAKFFSLLAEPRVYGGNFSHDEVFGHLAGGEFTIAEAAEYLGVSVSTFRRYVAQGQIRASSEVGRSHFFATTDLKAFKRAVQDIKGL